MAPPTESAESSEPALPCALEENLEPTCFAMDIAMSALGQSALPSNQHTCTIKVSDAALPRRNMVVDFLI